MLDGGGVGAWLGCVADDYTGATDVAAALRRAGMRTALVLGRPERGSRPPPCDAVVVALKSRTASPEAAVAASTGAYRWLLDLGVEQVYVKYCSTFDSTPRGNIGPVLDALLDAAGQTTTVLCPTTPAQGRTVYQGHLFVGSRLLSESPLRDHPLTPMTDPDLVRVLRPQTPHRVGLVDLATVRRGGAAIGGELRRHETQGTRHVLVDATDDDDLLAVAAACAGLPLVSGGAGLAGALGQLRRARDLGSASPDAGAGGPDGPTVVLAGSCSTATLTQVERAIAEMASYRLDPVRTPSESVMLERASAWVRQHLPTGPVLVYSSATRAARADGAAAAGPQVGALLERVLGELARVAVDVGARRVVVAGGETSGAVVSALGLQVLEVGDEEAPGVPWCRSTTSPALGLLLKSGNYGDDDILVRAAREGTQ